MSADLGEPTLKTGVLQGPPGAGKSSFIRNYAYKWSKPSEGEVTEEQKMWDLVVVLHVSTLRLSAHKSAKDQILQAIRQNLAGSEVDAIMEHLNSKNMDMKVLVIPDGMDECRNDITLEMLRALVDQSHKNMLPFSVFATSRSGLCPIKLSDFERRMKIDGFTSDQGLNCINCYYKNIKKPADDSIQDYINNNNGKLDHILTSPLYTHVFCVVTADGTLELKKGQRLGLKKLFEALEKTIKRRQIEKDGKMVEVDIEIQTRRFYKLCLYSLLKDIRTFDDSLLKRFDIHDRNPYFSFMKKKQLINENYEKIMVWQFTHEVWHEYLASCAIQALPEEQLNYFLLQLCSDSTFRNTQKILFSALGQHQDHSDILSGMVISTILLQGGKKEVSQNYPKSYSSQQSWSHNKEQGNPHSLAKDPLEILLQAEENNSNDASIATKKWDDIVSKTRLQRDRSKKGESFSLICYLKDTTDYEKLYEHRLKYLNPLGLPPVQLFHDGSLSCHINDCLHEMPKENQLEVFGTSIGNLLPCTM